MTNIWLWHRSLLDRHVSSTFRRSSTGYSACASTVSVLDSTFWLDSTLKIDPASPAINKTAVPRIGESCLWQKSTTLRRTLVGWLEFNGTFSRKRLYRALEELKLRRRQIVHPCIPIWRPLKILPPTNKPRPRQSFTITPISRTAAEISKNFKTSTYLAFWGKHLGYRRVLYIFRERPSTC